MYTYTVIQMIVDTKSFDRKSGEHNVKMSNIVRKVEASSKEEAIGKFVENTKDVRAHQRLNIECYKTSELITI